MKMLLTRLTALTALTALLTIGVDSVVCVDSLMACAESDALDNVRKNQDASRY